MSGPKPAEWERHRKEIVELYLEKATLREVAEIMEARYGFKAEAWQYKYQLQPWNVRKRPTKEQRDKIARLVLRHRQRGIDARYHRRGNQLLKRTLDRWVEELCVLRGTASVRSSELSNITSLHLIFVDHGDHQMRETSAREPAAGYADEAGPVDFVLEDSTSMLASVGSIDADNMALVNQTIDPFAPFEFTPPTAPGNSVQGQMFDNVHNTRVGDISLIGKDGDHPGQPVPSGSMDVLAGQFAIPETAEPRLNNRQVSEALMEILDRAEMPCPSDDSMAGWLAGTFNVGFDSALDPVLYAGITLRIVCLEGSVDFVVA